MKNAAQHIKRIRSIKELHTLNGLPSPLNPLITIMDHSKTIDADPSGNQKLNLDFYAITIKRSFKGELKYGKNTYDFDEGTMSFVRPIRL